MPKIEIHRFICSHWSGNNFWHVESLTEHTTTLYHICCDLSLYNWQKEISHSTKMRSRASAAPSTLHWPNCTVTVRNLKVEVPPAILSTLSKAGWTSLSNWSWILPPSSGPISVWNTTSSDGKNCQIIQVILRNTVTMSHCVLLVSAFRKEKQQRYCRRKTGWKLEGFSISGAAGAF